MINTDAATLREWYDDPDYPILYPVMSYLWPYLDDETKRQAIDDAAGGGDDQWAGLDYVLYQAAHQGIRVPGELLDMLEAQPEELFDQISIPASVATLRQMNEDAA